MKFDSRIRLERAEQVYPPSEDTMLLLENVEVKPHDRVLEIGTGTGIIALHAARVADVVATDINPSAVELARQNAVVNGLRLAVVRCDLLGGLRGAFDVIIFNPPYLKEKIGGGWAERAWQGGATGEDVVLRFLTKVPRNLAPGGRVYLIVPTDTGREIAFALRRFKVSVLAEKPLFFERLSVLMLTPR